MNGTSGHAKASRAAEEAARTSYGRLLASLSLRSRDIAAAEDALSTAFAAALSTWPTKGVPDKPDAWLFTVARNHLSNAFRSARTQSSSVLEIERRYFSGNTPPDDDRHDRRLQLAFVCAHPSIDEAARAPLLLQTVLGIDAARIAQAFMIEPATLSQRLVRAKARIRDSGLRFDLPDSATMATRLSAVLDAIYAAFSLGWDRIEPVEAHESLTGEAIWLARLIVDLMPKEPEPKGLLALMLYCTARANARRDATGCFVPLDRQDAGLWDRTMIIEAENLLTSASRARLFGRYQCEAAIQSVHVQRPVTGRTNRDALIMLYEMLATFGNSMGATISRAVVIAENGDPARALEILDTLDQHRMRAHQPFWVARARIEDLSGDRMSAPRSLKLAISLTSDAAVTRHLEKWLTRYADDGDA